MWIPRRGFLVLCGVLVLSECASRARAEEAAKPLFTFAVVSDTHLGRGGKSAAEWMRAATAEINGSPAELTIFLGDLVESGAKHEDLYPEWLTIANVLRKPFYPVPGNHDPVELFKKHIRPDTDYAFDHKGYRFVLFNDAEPGSHDGAATAEQLKWLGEQVGDAAAKKLRVFLCAHITAHPNKHPDVAWWVRKGEKELDELLRAKSGTIVAFLAGHFHCGLRGWEDRARIHEVVVPSLAWNSPRNLAGAPGYALEEHRRGYVLVDVYAERLVVAYKPLGAEARGVKTLELRPKGRE